MAEHGLQWPSLCVLSLVTNIGVGLVPRGHWKEHVPDPSSLDPGFRSVVSISSADDCDVCAIDADIAEAPVDNSDYPIEPVASNHHLSESSDRVSPPVCITSAILEVTNDRSVLPVDTPALVSEPDCFPPTLPDCRSEPSDDEFLDQESSFSSVNQQRDPGLVHARPHPVSVDPVLGLLPGFCFLFTETDDSGRPVVDSPGRLVAGTGFARQRVEGLFHGCGLFRERLYRYFGFPDGAFNSTRSF